MEPTAKIALNGPDGEVETLWAFDLGGGLYTLDNLPWYSYGVSVGDTIAASPSSDGQLTFERVVQKSGNRTLRVILQSAEAGDELTFESQGVLAMLNAMGCGWEGATKRYLAINLPPAVSLKAVTTFLETTDARWEYADPTPEEMGIVPDSPDDPESSAAG